MVGEGLRLLVSLWNVYKKPVICKFITDGRVTEPAEGSSEEEENAELPALTFWMHEDPLEHVWKVSLPAEQVMCPAVMAQAALSFGKQGRQSPASLSLI